MHEISAPYQACALGLAGRLPSLSLAILFALTVSSAALADPLKTEVAQANVNLDKTAPVTVPSSFSAPSLPTAVAPIKVSSPRKLPRAPDGFEVSVFASNLDRPRDIAVAPNGDIFVSQLGAGNIILLRDTDGDGASDSQTNFAEGFRQPSGLAMQPDALYVMDQRAVWRLAYKSGDTVNSDRIMITRPGALGTATSRPFHGITFSKDGKHFYVSIGSQNDVAEESLPQASIQKFSADGSAQTTYASGLRYPTALAFDPATEKLFAVVNERDTIPGDAVSDFFTSVRKDGFYGWPYSYNGTTPDPQFGDLRPDLVKTALTPDLLLPAHSSPTGLLIYAGKSMPKEFQGSAFIALHGSRDVSKPIGYKVVRIKLEKGKPVGEAENFITGFWRMEGGRAEIWGRPCAIAEAQDGALLISDDVAEVIWRIKWTGKQPEAGVAGNDGKNLSFSPQ